MLSSLTHSATAVKAHFNSNSCSRLAFHKCHRRSSTAPHSSVNKPRQLHLQCSAASDSPSLSSGGDSGQPPKHTKQTAEDSSSGEGDGGSNNSSSSAPQRTWPRWYSVWIWATALLYLVWRYKWRRDRRFAAEQFALEQQQEEELKQEWYSFAKSYGVKTPPPTGTNS